MELIGGQALIEGVMMVGPKKMALAVRRENGRISTQVEKRKPFYLTMRKIFFLRGIFALIEMIITGSRALLWSTHENEQEDLPRWGMMLTLLVSLLFGAGLFVVLPLWLSSLVTSQRFLFNLLDGVLRIVIFIVYIFIISYMKDIRRMFEYHGAEHMTIHCYEAQQPLEPSSVRKFSTLHPRCGTAFLFIVLLLSIILFSFIWSDAWLVKFSTRILLIPVIAGISYEILKMSAKHQDHPFFRILIMPGLWLQMITTQEPDKKQIEVAITALKKAL